MNPLAHFWKAVNGRLKYLDCNVETHHEREIRRIAVLVYWRNSNSADCNPCECAFIIQEFINAYNSITKPK